MNDNQPIETEVVRPEQAIALRPHGALVPHAQPDDYRGLMGLAKELCSTGFLPVAVKTPAQAVAIILTGKELGLGPMQSLRSISIIQGKPELAADLQLSIFHRDGGRSKWLELTETRAVLWLRHPNGDEHRETFSMDDARRAGLANGQNWQKYPKAMLRSRAITAGLKSIGFEPLAGAYAPGEIGGPEVVPPDLPPEDGVNAPESLQMPQDEPQPPPRSPMAGTPANAAPTPKPASPASLPVATVEKRAKMIDQLNAKPGQPDRDIVTEYFRKAEKLLPNEELEDLPLRWVPVLKSQYDALVTCIRDFGNGGQAGFPYKANPEPATDAPPPAPPAPAIEVPRDTTAPPPEHPEDWFFKVIVPVPHKGERREDYIKHPDTIGSLFDARHDQDEEVAKAARQRLFGFIGHFEPKGWQKRDGTQMPPSEADKKFREALDAFVAWFEKNHPGEKI